MRVAAVIVTFDGIDTLTADAGNTNSLTGASSVNDWAVTVDDIGTLDVGGQQLAWNNFADVTGGPAADTFVFSNGVTLSGTLDGGGGTSDVLGRWRRTRR